MKDLFEYLVDKSSDLKATKDNCHFCFFSQHWDDGEMVGVAFTADEINNPALKPLLDLPLMYGRGNIHSDLESAVHFARDPHTSFSITLRKIDGKWRGVCHEEYGMKQHIKMMLGESDRFHNLEYYNVFIYDQFETYRDSFYKEGR